MKKKTIKSTKAHWHRLLSLTHSNHFTRFLLFFFFVHFCSFFFTYSLTVSPVIHIFFLFAFLYFISKQAWLMFTSMLSNTFVYVCIIICFSFILLVFYAIFFFLLHLEKNFFYSTSYDLNTWFSTCDTIQYIVCWSVIAIRWIYSFYFYVVLLHLRIIATWPYFRNCLEWAIDLIFVFHFLSFSFFMVCFAKSKDGKS